MAELLSVASSAGADRVIGRKYVRFVYQSGRKKDSHKMLSDGRKIERSPSCPTTCDHYLQSIKRAGNFLCNLQDMRIEHRGLKIAVAEQ